MTRVHPENVFLVDFLIYIADLGPVISSHETEVVPAYGKANESAHGIRLVAARANCSKHQRWTWQKRVLRGGMWHTERTTRNL